MKAIDLDIGEVVRGLTNLLDPLRNGKQRRFGGVGHDDHNYLIKELAPPLNDIQVPEGNRVKATGIDGNHAFSFREI